VIKAGSCNNGKDSCQPVGQNGNSTIGANSCKGYFETCSMNGYRGEAVIGENSCNIEGNYTCYENGIYIKK